MKKRIVSLLLCLVFCLALLPPAARADAEDTEVATYAELQSALNRGDASIRLTQDIAYNVPADADPRVSVPAGKNVTLNLNGYTLSVINSRDVVSRWGEDALISLTGGASLTIGINFSRQRGKIVVANARQRGQDAPIFAEVSGSDSQLTLMDTMVTPELTVTSGTMIKVADGGTLSVDFGLVYADMGFAVTLDGSSTLYTSNGAVLGSSFRNGTVGTVANGGAGVGALRARYDKAHDKTPDIVCQYCYFTSGIQIDPEVLTGNSSVFTPSGNGDIYIENEKRLDLPASETPPGGSGYYWRTDTECDGCALVRRSDPNRFAQNVESFVRGTNLRVYVNDDNGTTWRNTTAGATVDITAQDVPGRPFDHWEVNRGGVTLADPGASTTSFQVGRRPVMLTAVRRNEVAAVTLSGVALPETGETPDASVQIPEGANYTVVSSAWYPHGEITPQTAPYAAKSYYTLQITLAPKNGYSFAQAAAATINGEPSKVKSGNNGTVIVSGTYRTEGTPVKSVALATYINSEKVREPLVGDRPVYDAVMQSTGAKVYENYVADGFVDGVRWDDLTTGDLLTKDSTLLAGHRYQMTVRLIHDVGGYPGWSFWVDPKTGTADVAVTINGVNAKTVTGDLNIIEAVCEFPPLSSAYFEDLILRDMDDNMLNAIPESDFKVFATVYFAIGGGDGQSPKLVAAGFDAAGRMVSSSVADLIKRNSYDGMNLDEYTANCSLANDGGTVKTVRLFCVSGGAWVPLAHVPYQID